MADEARTTARTSAHREDTLWDFFIASGFSSASTPLAATIIIETPDSSGNQPQEDRSLQTSRNSTLPLSVGSSLWTHHASPCSVRKAQRNLLAGGIICPRDLTTVSSASPTTSKEYAPSIIIF